MTWREWLDVKEVEPLKPVVSKCIYCGIPILSHPDRTADACGKCYSKLSIEEKIFLERAFRERGPS